MRKFSVALVALGVCACSSPSVGVKEHVLTVGGSTSSGQGSSSSEGSSSGQETSSGQGSSSETSSSGSGGTGGSDGAGGSENQGGSGGGGSEATSSSSSSGAMNGSGGSGGSGGSSSTSSSTSSSGSSSMSSSSSSSSSGASACSNVSVLANAGSAYPYSIVTDGISVYWANASPASVLKVSICGGAVETTYADGAEESLLLALDSDNVYWTANSGGSSPSSIQKCAKNGCNNSPTTLFTEPSDGYAVVPIGNVTVQDDSVYWAMEVDGILKMPSSGGAQTTVASGTEPNGVLTSDADGVYWIGGVGQTSLWKCSLNGCGSNATALSTTVGNSFIAVDAVNVYTADYGNGSVYACSKSGCGANPKKLANGNAITSLATDGVDVFWTDGDGMSTGEIMKCAVGGCGMNPTTLTTVPSVIQKIAVDATSVYWTTLSGLVMRMSK